MRFYAFGPFVVDSARRTIHRNGVALPLSSRAFDTLLLLIHHRERVVEKDELLQEVWRGVVVEENTLVRHISTIRHSLDESPAEHNYIVTIPGRGYRFVAQVDERDEPFQSVTSPGSPEPADARPLKVGPAPVQLPRRLWLGLAFAMVATALLSWFYRMPPVTTRADRDTRAQTTLWQLTFDEGRQGEPTWSPDGRMLAYSSDRAGNMDVWVQSPDGGQSRQITSSPADEWQPDWSPDGRYLVFRTEGHDGGLSIVPAHGGSATKLSASGNRPRWSPTGALILFERAAQRGGPRELVIVNPDGTEPRPVLRSFLEQFKRFEVAWHPDGRRLSIWGVHRRAGLSFWTVPLQGGEPVQSLVGGEVAAGMSESGLQFLDADGAPTRFNWSASGDALYFEGSARGVRNLWRVGVNRETLAWSQGPERLTTGSELNGQLAVSRDGHRLAFVARRERVRLWSFPFDANRGTTHGAATPITPTTFDALSPDLSPDGTRVIYKADIGGSQELREHVLESGKDTVLVTGDRYSRWLPRWTNDSHRVAYGRGVDPDSHNDIVMLDTLSGREEIITSMNGQLDLALDMSADGAWMLGSSRGASGLYSLSLVSMKGTPGGPSASKQLAAEPTSNLWQARLSPNQEWIAFSAAKRGVSAIQALPTSGGIPITITNGEFFDDRPRWSPDGRIIYFLSNRDGPLNLWARRFDPVHGAPVGEVFQVTTLTHPSGMIPTRMAQLGLAIAADRLILPISEASSNIWILQNAGR